MQDVCDTVKKMLLALLQSESGLRGRALCAQAGISGREACECFLECMSSPFGLIMVRGRMRPYPPYESDWTLTDLGRKEALALQAAKPTSMSEEEMKLLKVLRIVASSAVSSSWLHQGFWGARDQGFITFSGPDKKSGTLCLYPVDFTDSGYEKLIELEMQARGQTWAASLSKKEQALLRILFEIHFDVPMPYADNDLYDNAHQRAITEGLMERVKDGLPELVANYGLTAKGEEYLLGRLPEWVNEVT